MSVKRTLNILLAFVVLLVLSSLGSTSFARVMRIPSYKGENPVPGRRAADFIQIDTLALKDTLFFPDSIARQDSLVATDSLTVPDSTKNKASIDAPIFSTARDSIVEDFSNGKKMIYFYGDVSVTSLFPSAHRCYASL